MATSVKPGKAMSQVKGRNSSEQIGLKRGGAKLVNSRNKRRAKDVAVQDTYASIRTGFAETLAKVFK